MKKRILSLVLAVVMVLCLVPAISMVSFAAEEDYSVLPDDTNKAHFLSLVEAYKDDVAVPAAALINAKLSGYLEMNKEITVAEQAEIIANAIRMLALNDEAHAQNIQIITEYLTANPLTASINQVNVSQALAKKLVYVDGATYESGYRLYAPRMTGNLLAWQAVSASGVTTTVDENLAPAWAAAIYAKGVWTPEAENNEAAQTAYIAAAINKIIADNEITSITRNTGDNIFTPLCDAVEFRVSIENLGTRNDSANAKGIGHNNDGPWIYISSGIEQILKQSNYGTNRVADFYLNFTDVAVEGEAEKFEAILNYYFAPGAGNYGYYEDLWYDDVHLVYFVDTSNLNNGYSTTVNSVLESDGSTTQVAATPSHFARFVKPAIVGNVGALSNNTFRPHVKVVGGYEIGKYFTVGTSANDVTLSADVDSEGYLRVMHDNSNNRWGVTNHAGFARFSGILVNFIYSYEQLSEKMTQHAHNAWANKNYTDYNFFKDNNVSMTANADGFYGGFTMQFATRLDLGYWSNEYYNAFAGAVNSSGSTTNWNVYATNLGYKLMGIVDANGRDGNDRSGALIHLSARSDGNSGYVRTYSFINTGYHSDTGIKIGGNSHAGDIGDFMSITLEAKYIDPVNKIAATTLLGLNGTIATDENANDKTKVKQIFETVGDRSFLPYLRVTNRSAMSNYPDSVNTAMINMQDKQMNNFRAYDVTLTEEQIAQNSFADLVYILGVDMTAYNTLSEVEKEAVRTTFSEANPDSVTKAEIENKINEIAALRVLAEQTAAEALTFTGFQARLHGNVGIRSVFNLDVTKLGDFELVAYGAMVGMAKTGADFDTYTVNYDGENITSANAAVISSLDSGFKTFGTAEKAHVLQKSEGLDNYYMFAYTVDYINGSIDESGAIDGQSYIDTNKDAEMFFRSFIILEASGINYIMYVDGASANYNNTSVSLAEVSNYYKTYNEGEYADNACIKAVVGNGDEE